MNWKALLQTLTAALVGTAANWAGTSVAPSVGPWAGLISAGLAVGAAYAAKSPWTSGPKAPAQPPATPKA